MTLGVAVMLVDPVATVCSCGSVLGWGRGAQPPPMRPSPVCAPLAMAAPVSSGDLMAVRNTSCK